MKKAIFILMLIAATLAAKQSNAQARPPVFRSPMIRPSVAVKPLGTISHPVNPPALHSLGPKKIADITTGLPQDPDSPGGVITYRMTMYDNQSDKIVPKGDEIYRYDTFKVMSITEVCIITTIVLSAGW
jgi:hypothetical protein